MNTPHASEREIPEVTAFAAEPLAPLDILLSALAAPASRISRTPHPRGNSSAIKCTTAILGPSLKSVENTAPCAGAFISALPMNVAPKKCQKGIMNVPQQMPQRSKAAFGQAAMATKPQNPCVFINPIIHTFHSWIFFFTAFMALLSSVSSSRSSSFASPALAARNDIQYGGISPAAVPPPHSTHAGSTASHTFIHVASTVAPSHLNRSSPFMANQMFSLVSNPTPPHASALLHTFRMCGKRKRRPLCMPVPSPMDDSTPRPTHHTRNSKLYLTSITAGVHGPGKLAR
mmetsp:Transcript_6365/g.26390  ORF Transcript_6365/g.26390 Transcript_6365/m.26390 type:complete len:288 (-) Transcript_6365:451-1314(-)